MGNALFDHDLWSKLNEESFFNGSSHYKLTGLLPKTAYTFRLAINYTNSSYNSYFWPPDTRFTFKTLGEWFYCLTMDFTLFIVINLIRSILYFTYTLLLFIFIPIFNSCIYIIPPSFYKYESCLCCF